MKKYERSFVNPLLALAFIEGVEFLNDERLTCEPPKCEAPNHWIVVINDDDDDLEIDEGLAEDNNDSVIQITNELLTAVETSITIEKDKSPQIKEPVKVKPLSVIQMAEQGKLDEEISLIKQMGKSKSNITQIKKWPCNQCLRCSNRESCIEEINAAIIAQNSI